MKVREALEAWLLALVRGWALLGGVLLLAVAVATVYSVVGRVLFGQPLLGDFELTELATVVSVFMFLPLAQLERAHTAIDIFTQNRSNAFKRRCQQVGDLLFLAFAVLLTWRMTLGAQDLRTAAEVTMILGIPRYWAFPVIVLSLLLLCFVLVRALVLPPPPLSPPPPAAESGKPLASRS